MVESNAVIKEFITRDVFYNNGLVNLKIYLDENYISGVKYELTTNKLTLEIQNGKEDEYYNDILEGFLINNNIVFNTDNDRLYWNIENNNFVYQKKYDIQGKSSGNDVKYLYKYIMPNELGKTTEELFDMYIDFAKKSGLKESSIKTDTEIFKKGSEFKKSNQCDIPIFMTKSEAIKSYIEYSVKGDLINFDSKIHQFEDGGFCFRDMLSNKDNYIDKWDALIYWFGVKVKRFYNLTYFIYLNSFDLLSLYEMKISFPHKISDESIRIKDEKKNEIRAIYTNVNLMQQLEFDGVENRNFYISSDIKEFQVKFLMYLVSYIYHIESMYENIDKEKIRKRKEKLYNGLSKISYVNYTEDGNMKSTLEEYSKAYRLIIFFKKLMETGTKDSTLFKYFADLITTINMSKSSKEKINLEIKRFCENILKFADLRKVYYDVAFKSLRNNSRNLGSYLYYFEDMYLKETKREEYIMKLHSKSKKLGEEIGVFSANIDDKDLLFKLRNIKNHKQMISYFKDFKFSILRKQDDARFSAEFNEIMEEIFMELEEKPQNWEIVRDYIAIYAVDKYKSVSYAKKLNKGGK
ncbi:hypothetical protein [Clostridium beijerinckii]|uniref:hypothetical protein n=1 Tax=Clostridium beijerinckii TaxID=1520 RepID=UPI0004790895|nr:hypothetical protein [Clostridium beijerinckii]